MSQNDVILQLVPIPRTVRIALIDRTIFTRERAGRIFDVVHQVETYLDPKRVFLFNALQRRYSNIEPKLSALLQVPKTAFQEVQLLN